MTENTTAARPTTSKRLPRFLSVTWRRGPTLAIRCSPARTSTDIFDTPSPGPTVPGPCRRYGWPSLVAETRVAEHPTFTTRQSPPGCLHVAPVSAHLRPPCRSDRLSLLKRLDTGVQDTTADGDAGQEPWVEVEAHQHERHRSRPDSDQAPPALVSNEADPCEREPESRHQCQRHRQGPSIAEHPGVRRPEGLTRFRWTHPNRRGDEPVGDDEPSYQNSNHLHAPPLGLDPAWPRGEAPLRVWG